MEELWQTCCSIFLLVKLTNWSDYHQLSEQRRRTKVLPPNTPWQNASEIIQSVLLTYRTSSQSTAETSVSLQEWAWNELWVSCSVSSPPAHCSLTKVAPAWIWFNMFAWVSVDLRHATKRCDLSQRKKRICRRAQDLPCKSLCKDSCQSTCGTEFSLSGSTCKAS